MERFGWNEAWVGYSLAFVGLMVALVQGVLIGLVVPRLGPQPLRCTWVCSCTRWASCCLRWPPGAG
jgi:hypothetical protein